MGSNSDLNVITSRLVVRYPTSERVRVYLRSSVKIREAGVEEIQSPELQCGTRGPNPTVLGAERNETSSGYVTEDAVVEVTCR